MNSKTSLYAPETAELKNQFNISLVNGNLNDEFPLSIYQTLSGIHTDFNVNEVISNRAIQKYLVVQLEVKYLGVHPIDHVNLNQNSALSFIIVMHMSTAHQLNTYLYPRLEYLQKVLRQKSQDFSSMCRFSGLIPIEANELFFGQHINQISSIVNVLKACEKRLYSLTIDETVKGRQILTGYSFGVLVALCLARFSKRQFIYEPNKFYELNTYNIMTELSAVFNTLAINLMKIVNDILWICSKIRSIIGTYLSLI
ncbi:hypothetical protein I4U23_017336 [Adineta vaga]|nr:hypothetical protein I4U23_017336 [Adineta vaga]